MPKFFGFVGFGRPTLHREMPKITAIACHLLTDARSCVSAPMRSKCLAAEAAKQQPTTFPKAQLCAVQLIIRFWVALHGSINIPTIRQTLTVRKTPRDLRAREFPQTQGDGADGRSHRG